LIDNLPRIVIALFGKRILNVLKNKAYPLGIAAFVSFAESLGTPATILVLFLRPVLGVTYAMEFKHIKVLYVILGPGTTMQGLMKKDSSQIRISLIWNP
jgi:hypothetical protein